jgi:hypothetical protein
MTNVVRTSPRTSPHVNLGASPSSSGATQLVAAAVGAKYRVLSVVVVSTLANAIKFQSASTDITATFPLGANGGLVLPFNEHGWFETSTNEALNINMGTATATGVQIQYIKLPVDQ